MNNETMSAADVLATIARHRDTHESLGVVDAYSAQEYPRLRDAHAAVAALVARNAELEAERDALRKDAERWRHARKLLTIDDIEGMQGAYESFGRLVSEDECARADAAIDAARAEGRSHG